MKGKEILQDLERLQFIRNKYNRDRDEIYSKFNLSDVGDYNLPNGSLAKIYVPNKYLYSDKFLKKIERLYRKEKQIDKKAEKKLYVKFFKPDDNETIHS